MIGNFIILIFFSYDQKLQIAPRNLNFWDEKANLLKQLGKFDKANNWFNLNIILILSYDKKLQIEPENLDFLDEKIHCLK